MTKSKIGDRGKAAEKEVDKVLRIMNNRSDFAYWRLPDARAARGFLSAQPGDFCYFTTMAGTFCGGIIEVKETEHAYRIAKDKISQLATLQKFEWAGASSVIVIHHSVEDVWRAFKPSDIEIGPASWDLRRFATHTTALAALKSTGYF
jgi:hypothetical protein